MTRSAGAGGGFYKNLCEFFIYLHFQTMLILFLFFTIFSTKSHHTFAALAKKSYMKFNNPLAKDIVF
jgi:hypothetical protein